MRFSKGFLLGSALVISSAAAAQDNRIEVSIGDSAVEAVELSDGQNAEELRMSDEAALDLDNYDFDSLTQSFSLRSLPVGAATIENGKTYSVVSRFSGKCWDVVDHSLSEGAAVQQWDCHGKNNQKFLASLTYKSGFILTPVESNIRLQIANNDLNNGARLVQASYAAGNNGFFFVRPTATSAVFTITANHSSKCLDVVDVNPRNGARLQQWDCHGKSNQDWILVEQK